MTTIDSRFIRKLLKPKTVLFIGILGIALALRLYNYEAYPFGVDQLQILENAERIASGKPTLIGPRTGPAEMFTGPLIYYITAIILFLAQSPYAIVISAVSIAIVTGISLFILAYRYLGEKYAWVVFSVWAISPFLVYMDRTPWNPNLMVLAASLVFYPLLKQSKMNMVDLVMIGSGVFLGYQAHFAGFLLLPLVFLSSLINKHWKKINIYALLGLIFSILPTFIFDIRHNWLNTYGLIALITNKDSVSDYGLPDRLWHTGSIVIETLGKILILGQSYLVLISVGALLLTIFVYTEFRSKRFSRLYLALGWIIAVIVGFSFYRGSTPEYYFLLLVPVFMLVISRVLINMLPRTFLVIAIMALSLYTSNMVLSKYQLDSGFEIGHQIMIKNHINIIASEQGVREIMYDMQPIDSLGIRYILKDIDYSDDGDIVRVIFPYNEYERKLTTIYISDNLAIVITTDP